MAFFDALLGKGGPSPNATYADQTAALRRGRRQATGRYEAGRDQAIGYVNPYIESGATANRLYAGSIGAGGDEGYQEAFRAFEADPFRAGSDLAARNEADRVFSRYNHYGYGNSGQARVGVPLAASKLYDARVADFRNRLAGLGGQGLTASQFAGTTAFNTGKALGDLDWGYGQQKAGLMGYRDNALREQASAGVNNLLKLGSLGVQAAGVAMGMPPIPTGSASGNANFNGGGYDNIPRRYSFNPTGR